MELIAIIFLLWLIGCAFPGSGQSYGYSGGEVLGFLVCALLLVAMFCAYRYTFAGIVLAGDWLGLNSGVTLLVALVSPIAVPMIIAGCVHARRSNAKPQEFGSALTYARRYSLSDIVGIASEEDDDGGVNQ